MSDIIKTSPHLHALTWLPICIPYHIKPSLGVSTSYYINIIWHYWFSFQSHAQGFVTTRKQNIDTDVTSAVYRNKVSHFGAQTGKLHVFFRNTPYKSRYVINRISRSCLFIITFNKLLNLAEYDAHQGSRHVILENSFNKSDNK